MRPSKSCRRGGWGEGSRVLEGERCFGGRRTEDMVGAERSRGDEAGGDGAAEEAADGRGRNWRSCWAGRVFVMVLRCVSFRKFGTLQLRRCSMRKCSKGVR
jgi:hypothetical protein